MVQSHGTILLMLFIASQKVILFGPQDHSFSVQAKHKLSNGSGTIKFGWCIFALLPSNKDERIFSDIRGMFQSYVPKLYLVLIKLLSLQIIIFCFCANNFE